MIVVIQCAGRKQPQAGFLRTKQGKKVKFVADPSKAPVSSELIYARIDDPSDSGVSWRESLLQYNQRSDDNPLDLYPAFQLYSHPVYGQLAEKFGLEKTYILSAGWGLIGASFLTPVYDITFSMSAEKYKRRKRSDSYRDLYMLPNDADEPIVFFGGHDYLPLFCSLTKNVKGPRAVFYNSAQSPRAPGCSLIRFPTATRTNWHYECAKDFATGNLQIDAAFEQGSGR
jgi:hypothetical protein